MPRNALPFCIAIPDRKSLGRLSVGLGAMALVGALGAYIYARTFVHSATQAKGRVVALKVDDSDSTAFHTVFKFHDTADKEHTITSDLASSPPEYHVGDPIVVLYDPASPTNAKIQNFFSVWYLTVILSILGPAAIAQGTSLLQWPRIEAKLTRRPPKIEVV